MIDIVIYRVSERATHVSLNIIHNTISHTLSNTLFRIYSGTSSRMWIRVV